MFPPQTTPFRPNRDQNGHRLLAFDGEQVTFRRKDYAHGNRQREMTLQAAEFPRRFIQHLLPPGFVRIRSCGFLANRWRARSLPLCRELLATAALPRSPNASTTPTSAT